MTTKYEYGEIILKSKNLDEIQAKFNELCEQGYKKGDMPMSDLDIDNYSYVIVLNSDNYIDVEYEVPIIEHTILSKAELKYKLGEIL